jgi:hypothetical protein
VNGTATAFRFDHPLLRLTAVAVAAGLVLSTAGAFDTEASPFGARTFYWLAIAALSIAALEGFHRLASRHVPAGQALLLRLIGWVVLVLPLNMVAVLSCKLLFGGTPSLGGFMVLLPGMAAILAALQFVLITMAQPAAPRRGFVQESAAPPASARGTAETLRHVLPQTIAGAAIVALEAHDHYVKVHSARGHALVRMRLRDAIDALGADGVQPHRSWWVAREAIAGVQRESGRPVLVLETGQRVPVSRSARAEVAALAAPGSGSARRAD